jgi:ABC-type uncharacterized transport system involved in gliding motility auxiliary subunit/ABC-type transport system involved in multi-copper enzyme maturation permease subunit
MTGWQAIVRHEWRNAWATPLACTFIIIYILAAQLLAFFVGDFLPRGRADLQSFFQFQPWLLVVLAPALAMRSWSEDFQNGTAESLLTLPVSSFAVVAGKFLCQWLIASIAIAGTTTLWLTASWLGAPDHGVAIASYIACLLIAAVFLAMTNAISALCSSAISSFVISLISCALLLALGAPLMQGFFSDILPKAIALAVQDFSLLSSSRMMFRGLVRLPDLINLCFATLALVFITRTIVDRRRYIRRPRFEISVILVTILLSGIAASVFLGRVRLDLTQGKLFTLSDISRTLVQNLREPVRLHLMISGTGSSSYPQLQNHAQQVTDLLASYVKAGRGKIIAQTSIIEANSDSEDRAVAAGLEPVESPQGEPMYFGLLMSNSGNGIARIPFLAETADHQLEYDISRNIAKLAQTSPTKIGILSTLPLPTGRGGAFAALRGQSEPLRIFELLRAQYDVQLLTPDMLRLEDINLLMLLHPPALSPEAMRSITDFASRGGRILVVTDPWPERWQDVSGSLTSQQNLAPLLGQWGLSLTPDSVVIDKAHAEIVRTATASGTAQLLSYPMWLKLGNISLRSSGAWQVAANTALKITPLLRGSPQAASITLAQAMTNPAPEALAAIPASGTSPLLALRADGPALHGIFIADADMLDDSLWEAQNGNGDFLLGAVEALLGKSQLSALRNRPSAVRPFTRLQALQAAAQADYADKSAALMADLAATRARLAALEQSGDTSARRSADIAAFRQRALETRQALRSVDRTLTRRSRQIEQRIVAANIIFMPLLFGLLTLAHLMRRRKRMSRAR